jgi:threonine/homoserine/homoserine lactone efflux protein
MIGLGAVAMEAVYCAMALTGFSAFLQIPMVKSTMELLSFLFLLYLSWKYFSAKTIPEHVHSADVIEQKLHPRSAFMVGFVRVLGNPSVLLLWVTLTATFLSHTGSIKRWTIASPLSLAWPRERPSGSCCSPTASRAGTGASPASCSEWNTFQAH